MATVVLAASSQVGGLPGGGFRRRGACVTAPLAVPRAFSFEPGPQHHTHSARGSSTTTHAVPMPGGATLVFEVELLDLPGKKRNAEL